MKRLLAFFLALLLVQTLSLSAFAASGDGNIDSGDGSGGSGGSGMGSGSQQNYWNNEDGVRITILHNGAKVYQMDWSNQPENSVKRWFVKKNKLNYLQAASLEIVTGKQYSSTVVSKKMPTIVGGSGGNNIDAIKRYFTSELIIGYISAGVGIPFDQLTGGEYKLLLEPIAYV